MGKLLLKALHVWESRCPDYELLRSRLQYWFSGNIQSDKERINSYCILLPVFTSDYHALMCSSRQAIRDSLNLQVQKTRGIPGPFWKATCKKLCNENRLCFFTSCIIRLDSCFLSGLSNCSFDELQRRLSACAVYMWLALSPCFDYQMEVLPKLNCFVACRTIYTTGCSCVAWQFWSFSWSWASVLHFLLIFIPLRTRVFLTGMQKLKKIWLHLHVDLYVLKFYT